MTPRPVFHQILSICGINPLSFGALLLLFSYHSAQAEVWAFVDAEGRARFAASQIDNRYELYYRGGALPGAASDAATDAAAPPRPVAVPTAQARLLAYFEVAPGFLAVKHLLREAAVQQGIDYELLKALIATESGFDAAALSPRGAIGLMQVMPATAGRYGVVADQRGTVEQKLADPRTNIRTGTRHLNELMQRFPGQTELVLAAYNAGEGAVQRAGNRVPDYRETQNYVTTVMQIYALLKPPASLTQAPARTSLPPSRHLPSPARLAANESAF